MIFLYFFKPVSPKTAAPAKDPSEETIENVTDRMKDVATSDKNEDTTDGDVTVRRPRSQKRAMTDSEINLALSMQYFVFL